MRIHGIQRLLLTSFFSLQATTGLAQRPNGTLPPLMDSSLGDLRAGLDAGHFSSVHLVQAYLARIEETNSKFRAVREVNPDALALAAELDAQRREGSTQLGPLHGIPVLIKDNIATADGMDTTAGSYALLGARVREDSTVAAKLRRVGAIILGKTNMSQWASSRSWIMPEGWSALGGQTYGAYFPRQNPSGSSSGSAVASSLGLAWASLGTETATSIIAPAHVNNCVGIKPTVGLTSRYLVVPCSQHQDSVGPIARTVKDAAYLLAAIAGRDSRDNYTAAIPWSETPDYVAACKDTGLRGKRIGVVRNMEELYQDETSDVSFEAFNQSLHVLRRAGAEVVDGITFPGLQTIRDRRLQSPVLAADLLSGMQRYFAELVTNPSNITSLEDLVNFTKATAAESTYDTMIWDYVLTLNISDASPQAWDNYVEAMHYAGPLGLTGALEKHSLDALVMPSVYAALAASMIGTPVVSVPLGKASNDSPVIEHHAGTTVLTAPGQPFGIGFAGPAFSEQALIGMAYAFEQAYTVDNGTRVRESITPLDGPTTELADVLVAKRRRTRPKQ